MVAVQREKIYRKKEEIVARTIAGELFLVPIRGKLADMQHIFTLSPAAEFIWDQLDGKRNIGEIGTMILKEFEVGKEQANKDLQDFIEELLNAKLIEGMD